MPETRLTGTVVPVAVPAEHVVAAGVGSQVTYQRPGWTIGDLRAMVQTLPPEFDGNPILLPTPGDQPAAPMRAASMQVDPATNTTALALHTTQP